MWEDAAAPDDLPLNGAAMRIAPIGLWDCGREDRLADDVEQASIVTTRGSGEIEPGRGS